MTAVTKIMLLSSSRDSQSSDDIQRIMSEREIQDFYYRMTRSLATQSSLGYKTDADIDEYSLKPLIRVATRVRRGCHVKDK